MELPDKISLLLQAFGRVYRFGALKAQDFPTINIQKIFDDILQAYMSHKYIPQLIAEGNFEGVAQKDLPNAAGEILRQLLGRESKIDAMISEENVQGTNNGLTPNL